MEADRAHRLEEALRDLQTAPTDDGIYHRFTVDMSMPARIGNADAVRRYLVTVDLSVAVRVNGDIFGPGYEPREIWLPYPAPPDHRRARGGG